MKKFVSVLLAAVMVMTLAVTAFATKSYTVEELGVTLEIPDGYLVITRDISPTDSVFSMADIDYESLMDIMETGNIYLDAIGDNEEEIMLLEYAFPDVDNMEDIVDLEQEEFEENFIAGYEKSGIDVLEYLIYENSEHSYFKIKAYDESNSVYIMQYATIIDGRMYTLGLRSLTEITTSQISMMEEIVDSMSYDFVAAEVPATQEDTTYSFDFGGVEEETEAEDEYVDDEYEEDEDTDDEYEDAYADGYDSEPSSDSSFSIPGYVFIILIVILLAVIAAIVIVVISGKKKQAASANVTPTVQGNYPPVQPPVQNAYQPAPEQPRFVQPSAPVQPPVRNIQPEEIRPIQSAEQSKLPEEAPTIVAAPPAQPAAEEAPKASFCSNCGAAVAQGGAFCPMCGAKIG